MRLVVGVLALTLFASVVRAQDSTALEPAHPALEAPRGKVPLRVVRVMSESHQALLYDRSRSTHVLAEVGTKVDGYTVESIEDDEVTLSAGGRQVVLVAPARGANRRATERDEPALHVRSAAAVRQPDSTAEPGPLDPYGEPPIRVASAAGAAGASHATRAIEPGEGGVRVAAAPGATARAIAGSGTEGAGATAQTRVRVVEAPGVNAGATADGGGADSQDAVRSVEAPGATGTRSTEMATPAPSGDLAPRGADGTSFSPASGAQPVTAIGGVITGPAGTAPPTATTADAAVTSTRAAPLTAAATSSAASSTATMPPAPAAASVGGAPSRATTATVAVPAGASEHERAADQRTLDARALADVMTTGAPVRSARAPAPAVLPIAASGTSATPTPSDIRTVSAGAGDIRRVSAANPGATVLSRAEVDTALADFAQLTAAARGKFSPAGVVLDEVTDGSIFQRAGLQAGDVITAVDGVRLRSLDDAANLYARASTARALTAQVIRAGAAVTLHVAIE